MDPDATLDEIERLLDKARGGVWGAPHEPDERDAQRLCELVAALDGWMGRGGFPPKRWSNALAFSLDLMKLEAAGASKALDAGTWSAGWRSE